VDGFLSEKKKREKERKREGKKKRKREEEIRKDDISMLSCMMYCITE
jgi:hypothetical protein